MRAGEGSSGLLQNGSDSCGESVGRQPAPNVVTQRLRTAANSCGEARNPAPASSNPISSCPAGVTSEVYQTGLQFDSIRGIEPASASVQSGAQTGVTSLVSTKDRKWSSSNLGM